MMGIWWWLKVLGTIRLIKPQVVRFAVYCGLESKVADRGHERDVSNFPGPEMTVSKNECLTDFGHPIWGKLEHSSWCIILIGSLQWPSSGTYGWFQDTVLIRNPALVEVNSLKGHDWSIFKCNYKSKPELKLLLKLRIFLDVCVCVYIYICMQHCMHECMHSCNVMYCDVM